ncbi:MAG: outer membrane beta-barrel protein [Bdellovibrionales bacterium]|nr:outer membrane beta-barrel protein [Bdellovibrionales bacterium]
MRIRKFLFILILVLLPISSFANDPDLAVYWSHWGIGDGKDAEGFGARLGIPAFSDDTQIELRAATSLDGRSNKTEPDIDVIPLEFGLAYKPSFEKFSPFFSAGAGFYKLDTIDTVKIEDEWGWYTAAGFEIELPWSCSVYAELYYRAVDASIKGDLEPFDQYEAGVTTGDYDLSGIGANIGLNFTW